MSEESKTVDLTQFDNLKKSQDEGIPVRILHPGTGEDLGIVITIAGPDSDRQQKARASVLNRRIRQRRVKPLSADEIEQENLNLLASTVIDWSGVVLDGKTLDPTHENIVMVFKRFPFIRETVDSEAGDRAGFMRG